MSSKATGKADKSLVQNSKKSETKKHLNFRAFRGYSIVSCNDSVVDSLAEYCRTGKESISYNNDDCSSDNFDVFDDENKSNATLEKPVISDEANIDNVSVKSGATGDDTGSTRSGSIDITAKDLTNTQTSAAQTDISHVEQIASTEKARLEKILLEEQINQQQVENLLQYEVNNCAVDMEDVLGSLLGLPSSPKNKMLSSNQRDRTLYENPTDKKSNGQGAQPNDLSSQNAEKYIVTENLHEITSNLSTNVSKILPNDLCEELSSRSSENNPKRVLMDIPDASELEDVRKSYLEEYKNKKAADGALSSYEKNISHKNSHQISKSDNSPELQCKNVPENNEDRRKHVLNSDTKNKEATCETIDFPIMPRQLSSDGAPIEGEFTTFSRLDAANRARKTAKEQKSQVPKVADKQAPARPSRHFEKKQKQENVLDSSKVNINAGSRLQRQAQTEVQKQENVSDSSKVNINAGSSLQRQAQTEVQKQENVSESSKVNVNTGSRLQRQAEAEVQKQEIKKADTIPEFADFSNIQTSAAIKLKYSYDPNTARSRPRPKQKLTDIRVEAQEKQKQKVQEQLKLQEAKMTSGSSGDFNSRNELIDEAKQTSSYNTLDNDVLKNQNKTTTHEASQTILKVKDTVPAAGKNTWTISITISTSLKVIRCMKN